METLDILRHELPEVEDYKLILLSEFQDSPLMKLFEIEVDGEYYVYHINATIHGLEAGSCSNTGFGSMGLDKIEWDNCFSLDEHLQELYEIAYEDAINGER